MFGISLTPNTEQVKSSLRWLVTVSGGVLAGWFAKSGVITAEQVMGILNSETFISFAATVAVWVLSLFVHKESNAVAVADAVPTVKGIVMQPTAAGVAMAKEIPSATVVPAGTAAASNIAGA